MAGLVDLVDFDCCAGAGGACEGTAKRAFGLCAVWQPKLPNRIADAAISIGKCLIFMCINHLPPCRRLGEIGNRTTLSLDGSTLKQVCPSYFRNGPEVQDGMCGESRNGNVRELEQGASSCFPLSW